MKVADDGADVSRGAHKDDNISVQVITLKSIATAENEILRKVEALLEIKEYQARALLIRYEWDLEGLKEAYADKGKAIFLQEGGVSISEGRDDPSSSIVPVLSAEITCDVCLKFFSLDKTTTMDCGHCFCNDCWTAYFKVQVEERSGRQMKCMAYSCYTVCDEEVVRELLKPKWPKLVELFDRHLLVSYIEDNKMVKWCPSVPHCGSAVQVDGASTSDVVEVECTCGEQFCFTCLSQAHYPCTCAMWEHWSHKFEESESKVWIRNNTKKCPKCHVRIIRDGGCPRMKCRCEQHFCWDCGQSISNWRMDRFDGRHLCTSLARRRASKMSMTESRRLNKYKSRYIKHKTLDLELELNEVSKEITKEAEMNFPCLFKGFYTLVSCRRVLCYTYPFAFCMFEEMCKLGLLKKIKMMMKKKLFENLQTQLERNVEKLLQCITTYVDDELDDEYAMELKNTAAVTSYTCEKLVECIKNDLLGSLSKENAQNIALFQSTGVHLASDILNLPENSPVEDVDKNISNLSA